MKQFLSLIALVSSLPMVLPCSAETPCMVSVLPRVEIHGEVLRLSDLVSANACPELLEAAAEVRLGTAPLPGSLRVFEGAEIAARLKNLAHKLKVALSLAVSPRITVLRAGSRWACRDIGSQLLSGSANEGCGAEGRIAMDAPLEIARKFWDPAVQSWDLVVRCRRTADCVPFVVRLPQSGSKPPPPNAALQTGQGERDHGNELPLIRRGEKITLVWDQDGIRLLVPAVCLDEGHLGQMVRARTLRGNRMVRAAVVRAGALRVKE